jgi:hypothetical protein
MDMKENFQIYTCIKKGQLTEEQTAEHKNKLMWLLRSRHNKRQKTQST